MKYPSLLWCFILHFEALPFIPLHNRAIGIQSCNSDLDAHLQSDFLPQVFSLIDTYLSEWNLGLDLDGNIFSALLEIMLSDTKLSSSQRLGDSLSRIVTSIASPPDGPGHPKALTSAFPFQASHPQPHLLAAIPQELLPFRHDVFDDSFSLIKLPSRTSKEVVTYGALEFGRDTAFNDQYHWHNAKRHILPKHLGGEQAKPSTELQQMKMMRRHQRFMSRLTINAATLTGALGVPFDRLTIVAARSNEVPGKNSGNPVRSSSTNFFCWELILVSQAKGNRKPGKKEKPLSSKEKLLAEIAAKKLKKSVDEQQEWWQGRLKNKDLSGYDLDKNLETLAGLERNPRTAGGWLRDELLLYRLHLTILKWTSRLNDQHTDAVRDQYTVAIMRIVKELSESKNLTPTVHRAISDVLIVLGFGSFVTAPPENQPDRRLCFKFVGLLKSGSSRLSYEFMRITEDPITWQLRLFGEFMDRSIGSKPDPRVSFAPDVWQRKVLDCLDRNESVLVVGG